MTDDGVVIEIEQILLGALLLGRGLPAVRPFLRPDHFLEDTHRSIYQGICDAFDQSGATHLLLVRKLIPDHVDHGLRLRTDFDLSQYLARMLSDTPVGAMNSDVEIARAGKNVVEQHARITFAESMEAAAIAARSPVASLDRLLKSTGSTLEEISASLRTTHRARSRMTIEQAGRDVLKAVSDARASKGGLTGITWGLSDINRLTGGMQRKDLILMGARPSMGKTSAMTSAALAAGKAGHGVGILSLEMDATKLTARALSDLSLSNRNPIQYVDMLQGRLNDTANDDLAYLVDDLRELPIEIDEAPVNTFSIRMKIEAMLDRFQQKGWPRLDVLMLDHLGFVQPGDHYKGNRNNEVGEITRSLKDFAKEYNIAVLLLSQLSRQVTGRENKRPILSDLRDSGNIEQDADTVIFLHREAYYLDRLVEEGDKEIERAAKAEAAKNTMEFIIAKQRNGPVETVNVWCDMAYSAVRNGERHGYGYGEAA